MKAKHAAEIRKGVTEARYRARFPRPSGHIVTIYNSRHYSDLAVYAIQEYNRRHPSIQK